MKKLLLSLLLVAGLAQSGWAQIAVDNSTAGGYQNSGTALTFSHTVNSTTNGLLTVCGGTRNNAAPPETATATYNGSSMTQQVTRVDGTFGVIRVYLWTLKVADGLVTGTHDVVITFSGTPSESYGGAVSFTGVNQTTPVSNAIGNDDRTTDASVTVTSSAGSVVVDCMAAAGANLAAATATQTQQYSQISGGLTDLNGQSTAAGAASVNMGWTFGVVTNTWVALGMSLNVAATSTCRGALSLMGVGGC